MTDDKSLTDALTAPFAKGLTGIVLDIAKKAGGSIVEVIKDRIQAANALKKYEDKYRSRYGILKLLGMSQGVSLESVYTPVRFLNELSIHRFKSPVECKEAAVRVSQKTWKAIEERMLLPEKS